MQPCRKSEAKSRQQDHTSWAVGSPAAGNGLLVLEAGASMDQLVFNMGARSSTLQQQATQLGQAMQQRGITVRPASCVVGNALTVPHLGFCTELRALYDCRRGRDNNCNRPCTM